MTSPPLTAHAVRGQFQLRAEADATGRSILTHRHAAGAFHLSKPYWDGRALMVQWINPTAGIFAGDVLESEVRVECGAALLLTTPSATRIHTRRDPALAAGEQRQQFHVASGASLEVQPEWLIPQRGSAYRQQTDLQVAAGGTLFYAEMLAPGRVAHQETLEFAELDLRFRLFVAGQLVVQDRLSAKAPDHLWMLQSREGGAWFCANVFLILPGRQTIALHAIEALAIDARHLAVSRLPQDVIALRLLAGDALGLKQRLRLLRTALAPLCPAWQSNSRKL